VKTAAEKANATGAAAKAERENGARPSGVADEKAKASGALVERDKTAGAVTTSSVESMYEADSGMGMEGADKDSFALPFIAVLQGLSPQIETVEGAKPGLMINTVSNKLYASVRFIPVAFQRRYNRWLPRSAGGGFRGTLTVAEVETLIANKEATLVSEMVEGKKRSSLMYDDTQLKDTRNHFVLVIDDEGGYSPGLISCASTQIKRSKRMMSVINELKIKGAKGLFTPPSFASIFEATTEKETNAEGSWHSFVFARVGMNGNAEHYQAAKEFHALVMSGVIKVSPPPEDLGADGDDAGGGVETSAQGKAF